MNLNCLTRNTDLVDPLFSNPHSRRCEFICNFIDFHIYVYSHAHQIYLLESGLDGKVLLVPMDDMSNLIDAGLFEQMYISLELQVSDRLERPSRVAKISSLNIRDRGTTSS